MWRVAFGVALVAGIAAATSVALAAGHPGAPATRSSTDACTVARGAGPGYDASISNGSGDKTYCVHVGERILVFLSAPTPNSSPWGAVQVSPAGAVQHAPLTLMLSRGVTAANFKLIRVGRIALSATRPACKPVSSGAPMCAAIEVWRASLQVSPHH
jgi:hypothetical protein